MCQTRVRVWWSCEEMQRQESREGFQEMQRPRLEGPRPALGLKIPGRLRKVGLIPPGKSLAPARTQACRVVVLLEALSTSPSGRATGGDFRCGGCQRKSHSLLPVRRPGPQRGYRTHECRGSSSVGASGWGGCVHRPSGLAPLRFQGRPLPGRGCDCL